MSSIKNSKIGKMAMGSLTVSIKRDLQISQKRRV